jgi:CDP-diacylglycerol--serine O-phosphatidyltransferase
MRPRFKGHLSVADVVTATNAGLGFVAVAVASLDVQLAARLILLGAMLDAVDGLLARRYGGTATGPYLDSLADVATFGVAPALVVAVLARTQLSLGAPWHIVVTYALPAAFVMMAVVRLGMYTAYDTGNKHTEGVQSTLAATLIAAAVLANVPPTVIVGATAAFTALMVARVEYPDLVARDAVLMGVVQALAIFVPDAYGAVFPKVLLAWALGYLVLAPRFYWRREGKRS